MATTVKNNRLAESLKNLTAPPHWRILSALALSLLTFIGVLLGSAFDFYMFLAFPLGIIGAWLLLGRPEILLALFMIVGGVKAHPRLAAFQLPDMTLLLAGAVAAACLLDVIKHKKHFQLPKAFALYLPLALMVPVSVMYTVDFAQGLDKAGRFFLLTGLAILAPFIALDSKSRLHRFFYVLLTYGLLQVLDAVLEPQTTERLAAAGGALAGAVSYVGTFAEVGVIVIIFLAIPRASFLRRLPFYALFPLLAYGLVGSGFRRSVIGVLVCGVLALCFYPKLILDFAFLALGAAVILILMPIPDFSAEYLLTLINQSPHELYSIRQHLLDLGLNAGLTHPWGGVGIGAFRFFTPNPAMYDSPHNLFVEIFCEVGLIAAVSILLLQAYTAYRTAKNAIFAPPSYKREMVLALAFLVIGLIDSSVSGDMNDLRLTWLALSLPFVVSRIKESEDSLRVRDLRVHR